MTTRFTLIDAPQIEAICEMAFAALDRYYATDDHRRTPGAQREANIEWTASIEALRFCAQAIGLLGDAALAPLLNDIVTNLAHWGDDRHSPGEIAADAVTTLLHRGAAIDEGVEALAEHTDAAVREAVATGLQPTGDALPLLEKLARDPVTAVRNAAHAKLATVREVGWWTGLFASDPLTRLSEREAKRHREAFEALAAALTEPTYTPGETLGAALLALPDPFAVEIAEAVLAAPEVFRYRGEAMGKVLVTRPGGEEALIRLASKWTEDDGAHTKRYAGQELVCSALPALPKKRRIELALRLGRVAASAPIGEARGHNGAADLLATIAAEAFPIGADVTPMLELLLGMEMADGFDYVRSSLSKPLSEEGANVKHVIDRLADARIAGYPGNFAFAHGDEVLEHAPPRTLRRTAERAILTDHDETITWGLQKLLGPALDPRRDGPRNELVERFWAEPRYRRLIGQSLELSTFALPLLRDALRRGALDFEAAHNAMTLIDKFWGGAALIILFGRPKRRGVKAEPEPEPEAVQRLARKGLSDVLGPRSLQGPATDGEWTAYRAVRTNVPAAKWSTQREQLSMMPPGAWQADDRALVEAAIELGRAGNGAAAWAAAMALAGKPFAEDKAIMDELVAMAPEDKPYVADCRAHFRDALGLPMDEDDNDSAGTSGASADRPSSQWMDREDDD